MFLIVYLRYELCRKLKFIIFIIIIILIIYNYLSAIYKQNISIPSSFTVILWRAVSLFGVRGSIPDEVKNIMEVEI